MEALRINVIKKITWSARAHAALASELEQCPKERDLWGGTALHHSSASKPIPVFPYSKPLSGTSFCSHSPWPLLAAPT